MGLKREYEWHEIALIIVFYVFNYCVSVHVSMDCTAMCFSFLSFFCEYQPQKIVATRVRLKKKHILFLILLDLFFYHYDPYSYTLSMIYMHDNLNIWEIHHFPAFPVTVPQGFHATVSYRYTVKKSRFLGIPLKSGIEFQNTGIKHFTWNQVFVWE